MTPKQILIVCIRLFALVWGLHFLNTTVFLPQSDIAQNINQMTFWVMHGFFLVCWLFLWLFPATIAGLLLPEYQQEKQEIPNDTITWLNTGIVLIGIWGFYRGLMDFIAWLNILIVFNTEVSSKSAWQFLAADQKASVVVTLIECVISLILIFRANGIAKIISKHMR